METLCMAIECKTEINRHPYNFDDGFCESCKNKKNNILSEILTTK